MKIREIITEKRRGGDELNPRIPVINQLRTIFERMPGDERFKSFITMTQVNKIGINPTINYDTPVGIYAYHGPWVYRNIKSSLTELPWAGDYRYTTVFLGLGKILHLRGIQQAEVKPYIDSIIKIYSKIIGLKTIKTCINDARTKASVQTNGGRFWYITKSVSKVVSDKTNQKHQIVWNKLFRNIGIDAIHDGGEGIIYLTEPHQTVFFNTKSLKIIKTIDNKDYNTTENEIALMKYYASMSDDEKVTNIVTKSLPRHIQYIKHPSESVQLRIIEKFPVAIQWIEHPVDSAIKLAKSKGMTV